MNTKEFISAVESAAIEKLIVETEKRTSGEIRVFVSRRLIDDPLKEAQKEFVRLGMANTALRNGVLIYFAPKSQVFAIMGDQGVHEKAGDDFWKQIAEGMTRLLKTGNVAGAVELAVRQVGDVLAKHFPHLPGDRNELPNEIARDPDGS